MSEERSPTVADLLAPLVDVTDRGVHEGDSFVSWRDHVAAGARLASALTARLEPGRPPHIGVLLGNTTFFSTVLVAAGLSGLVPVGLNPTRACLPTLWMLTSEYWTVTRMGVISDEFWAVVEPLMPSDEGKCGRRFGDHRLILEGIAWRFRTGSPWRDLPADFGPWQTVWKRHHRWSLDGTYDTMFVQFAAVFGVDEMVEDLEKLLSVDSTSVRAHQHCAGARSDTLATGGSVELQESTR